MRRDTEPLKQKSMHLFVEAAESMSDDLKKLTALLLVFTGLRVNTFCHIHWSWFQHDEGDLYLRVPNEFTCRKYGTEEPCGDCNDHVGNSYSPKSDAGGGRRLMIPEKWHNHYTDTDEQQPLELRELVEHYFKMDESDYGNEMLNGKGISIKTAENYVKEVAAEAEIGFYRSPGYSDHPRFGKVPDVTPHDLRGTYCVQLMRNDANPFKSVEKTGHSDIESLKPYIQFAKQEFDGEFEKDYI